MSLNTGLSRLKQDGRGSHPLGKNPGDVWPLATAGYRGAHFATFPVALVQQPLLATCPERVCANCGQPWQRPPLDRRQIPPARRPLQAACRCGGGSMPGVVLDPFMGSGTVALAAEQHRRDWLGVELNPVYAALTQRRLDDWRREQGKQ